jgi:hypothetical protein
VSTQVHRIACRRAALSTSGRNVPVPWPPLVTGVRGYPRRVVVLLVLLLMVWAILAVVGLAFKGLFWLFIIGLILFIGTGLIGWARRRT